MGSQIQRHAWLCWGRAAEAAALRRRSERHNCPVADTFADGVTALRRRNERSNPLTAPAVVPNGVAGATAAPATAASQRFATCAKPIYQLQFILGIAGIVLLLLLLLLLGRHLSLLLLLLYYVFALAPNRLLFQFPYDLCLKLALLVEKPKPLLHHRPLMLSSSARQSISICQNPPQATVGSAAYDSPTELPLQVRSLPRAGVPPSESNHEQQLGLLTYYERMRVSNVDGAIKRDSVPSIRLTRRTPKRPWL